MNNTSLYFLLKWPHIWRSRVHIFLPLTLSLLVLFYFLGGIDRPLFFDVIPLSETIEQFYKLRLGITIIILPLVLAYWYYLLNSYPINNETPGKYLIFLCISLLINAVLLAGPAIYIHQKINELAEIIPPGTNIIQDLASSRLACRGNLSEEEKDELFQVYKKWNGNTDNHLEQIKIVPTSRIIKLLRDNNLQDKLFIDDLDITGIKYKKYHNIEALISEYQVICSGLKEQSDLNKIKANYLNWNYTFWSFDKELHGDLLLFTGKLDTLAKSYTYQTRPSIKSIFKFHPKTEFYIFLLLILAAISLVVSRKNTRLLQWTLNFLSVHYTSFRDKFTHNHWGLYLSNCWPVPWALGGNKWVSDIVIFGALPIAIALSIGRVLNRSVNEGLLVIIIGIFLFLFTFEKGTRQMSYPLCLNNSSGNSKIILASLAMLTPYMVFLAICLYILTKTDDVTDIFLFFIIYTLLFSLWSSSIALIATATSRLSLLLIAILSVPMQIGLMMSEILPDIDDDFEYYVFCFIIFFTLLAILLSKARPLFIIMLSALIPIIIFNLPLLVFKIVEDTNLHLILIEYFFDQPMGFEAEDTIHGYFILLAIILSIPLIAQALKKLYQYHIKPG